ncbi:MAG: hypothetical protein WAU41_08210 [Gaiellaceae bacterium]
MTEATKPARAATAVPKERTNFKALLAQNLNYFGNLEEKKLKPVKKIVFDTAFEELNCVGFNPDGNLLEATIAIKRATGYNGDLCQKGSTEYVRFFIDYGSGWQDAGLTGVNVHDIPDAKDCAGHAEKPLTYVAGLRLDPKQNCCTHPVLPRVRAILSWQWIPPAGSPNWHPVWGNVLECEIQIKPHPWNIFCLLEEVGSAIGQKIKIPPLFEEVQFNPIPIPDPPPFDVGQLAELYGGSTAKAAAKADNTQVASHRFGLPDLHVLAAEETGFDSDLFTSIATQWENVGLDLAAAIAAFEKTEADVSFEELECLGLEETFPERLVATFRIKRPTGYSGDLCHAGSREYVAFWADWDNKCEWTYVGTAAVNVHDIAKIPPQGLCYSAILPVDLTHHRRSCKQPKIGRVRAVLSWAVPPSTKNPDALTTWGNRIDTHVQIEPGPVVPPGDVSAKIRNIGGIAVEDFITSDPNPDFVGCTKAAPVMFANFPLTFADSLNRPCPFGGQVIVEGSFIDGYWYRVKMRRSTDPPTSFSVLGDSFWLERADFGFDLQTSVGGFFKYGNPATYFTHILAITSSGADGLWEIQLDLATGPADVDIFDSSPWYPIQIDNTPPSADVHIAAGGDCKDFDKGTEIDGFFVADDKYFGSWSLSTEPDTVSTPSNPPQADPALASTTHAPGPSGHGWKLRTAPPPAGLKTMKPCGYVVRIDVDDRSIRDSHPSLHNHANTAVGLCLRDA